jgi:ribosomal-protein-alanine N-acetyltransferase
MSTDASSEFLIETRHLGLQRFVADDLDFLIGLLGDPLTMHHWLAPLDAAEAANWLGRALESYDAHGFGRWRVVDRESSRPIGDVGMQKLQVNGRLENDLGYIIHRDYWGQGLGFEAAAGCVQWARAYGIDSVVASMAQDNIASIGVAEKLGMKLEDEFSNPRNANKPTRLYRLELGSVVT